MLWKREEVCVGGTKPKYLNGKFREIETKNPLGV